MSDVLYGMFLCVLGVLAYHFTLVIFGWELRKKYKYRFKCPICEFSVSTNELETLTIIQSRHLHSEVDI